MNEAEQLAWFSAPEPGALDDVRRVYDAHAQTLGDELWRRAASDAAFGPALRAEDEACRSHWMVFIRCCGSVAENEGAARDAALVRCQEFFSTRGVGQGSWERALFSQQELLLPLLIEAYGQDRRRLAASLRALQGHLAGVLETIGSAVRAAEQRALDQAQREAALASVRFKSLAESGMLGVLVCDYEGNIVEANDGFLETFGYTRQDLSSGSVQWSAMTPPEWRHLDDEAIEQLRLQGKTRPWEKEYFHKDGSRVPVLVGVAFLNESQTVAFVLDISERKRLESVRARSAELEAENRRIQEASRLKSEFLANMSHELRTPLNSIIGFAELLHDREVEPDSPQYSEFLEDILRSGRHLQQMINDVLDLAKVEAGKIELRPESVDVEQVIAEVSAVLRAVAAGKQIRIECRVEPEARCATLDPARLKQILYNYLSNALKFTPEGGKVTVTARREAVDMLCLAVEDTGIGIAPEDVRRLFVDFQQLEAGATKKHAGTGLGLALTKRLVEAQGGSVGVASTPGKGSQFFALLPRHAAPSGLAVEQAPAEYGLTEGASAVLVVEDDARDRALIVQTLTRAGYGVEAVATGRQALASCSGRVFDAITLDLLLPDMTGLDVLHRMRLDGKNQQTPVLVVSVVAERGMLAGFTVHDYLTKPVNGLELLRAFEQAGVPPRRGSKILVVDDDPAAQRLMSATLKDLGYEIHASAGGEDALAFAAVEQPLAVVLDLVMPGVDGLEFLTRFRGMTGNAGVPVIIWTMKDLSSEDHARLRALAQGIVEKNNWRPATFVETVRGLIVPGLGSTCRASEVA